MCIIIYNETGAPHNRQHLSNAYDNNPHGVGLMWVEDGRVRTLRGLFSKRQMFDILENFDGVPHALHLRWKTRGKIVKEMCHPFRASAENTAQRVWLMHNGTFMKVKSDEKHSDTFYFAKSMQHATAKHGTDVLFTESFLRKLEKEVESWNKVIFLRDDGKVAIANPSKWHVENGMWYSNTYSLQSGYRKRKTAIGTYGSWKPRQTAKTKDGASVQYFNGKPHVRCKDGVWRQTKDASVDKSSVQTKPAPAAKASTSKTKVVSSAQNSGGAPSYGSDWRTVLRAEAESKAKKKQKSSAHKLKGVTSDGYMQLNGKWWLLDENGVWHESPEGPPKPKSKRQKRREKKRRRAERKAKERAEKEARLLKIKQMHERAGSTNMRTGKSGRVLRRHWNEDGTVTETVIKVGGTI
jgi:hypothetical protein